MIPRLSPRLLHFSIRKHNPKHIKQRKVVSYTYIRGEKRIKCEFLLQRNLEYAKSFEIKQTNLQPGKGMGHYVE